MDTPTQAPASRHIEAPDFGPNTDLRVCLKNLMYGRPAGAQHFLQDCIAALQKCDGQPLPRQA